VPQDQGTASATSQRPAPISNSPVTRLRRIPAGATFSRTMRTVTTANHAASVLQWCQLKNAGCQERCATQKRTGTYHHRRKQGCLMQAPLQHRDHCAEAAPDDQVAQQENPRWDKGAFLLAALAIYCCEDQEHRRRRGHHHRRHHDDPHGEHQGLGRAAERLLRVLHVSCQIDSAGPRQHHHSHEPGDHNEAILLYHAFP
jgi:hypothetical protein